MRYSANSLSQVSRDSEPLWAQPSHILWSSQTRHRQNRLIPASVCANPIGFVGGLSLSKQPISISKNSTGPSFEGGLLSTFKRPAIFFFPDVATTTPINAVLLTKASAGWIYWATSRNPKDLARIEWAKPFKAVAWSFNYLVLVSRAPVATMLAW